MTKLTEIKNPLVNLINPYNKLNKLPHNGYSRRSCPKSSNRKPYISPTKHYFSMIVIAVMRKDLHQRDKQQLIIAGSLIRNKFKGT